MRMGRALALGAGLLLGAQSASAAPGAGRRVAVVVGANAAVSGRAALHYAHLDARRMADVLTDVGEFAKQDVVLLLDPAPAAVLSALDQQLAALKGLPGETLLLFYYSGHADSSALYPSGRPLSLEQLRQRVDAAGATARVGIIDACRGGGWTQAKGLQAEATPFEVKVPLVLSSEGSVLISSSSGLENAHEAEAFEGSFFTHHLVAGLRGAADRAQDGEVSLVEAFDYARGLTVRDTALLGATPQHPSFDFNLRGRSDLSLTRVSGGASHLRLQQASGPLKVLQAASGGQVAELHEGERSALLALPPGRYLVLRRDADGTRAREVTLTAGQTTTLAESSLEPVQPSLLALKGPEPRRNTLTLTGLGISSVGSPLGALAFEYEHALGAQLSLSGEPSIDFNGGVGVTLAGHWFPYGKAPGGLFVGPLLYGRRVWDGYARPGYSTLGFGLEAGYTLMWRRLVASAGLEVGKYRHWEPERVTWGKGVEFSPRLNLGFSF